MGTHDFIHNKGGFVSYSFTDIMKNLNIARLIMRLTVYNLVKRDSTMKVYNFTIIQCYIQLTYFWYNKTRIFTQIKATTMGDARFEKKLQSFAFWVCILLWKYQSRCFIVMRCSYNGLPYSREWVKEQLHSYPQEQWQHNRIWFCFYQSRYLKKVCYIIKAHGRG